MKKILGLCLLIVNFLHAVDQTAPSEAKGVDLNAPLITIPLDQYQSIKSELPADYVAIQASESSPVWLMPEQQARRSALFQDFGFDETINLYGLSPASDQILAKVMQWLAGQPVAWQDLSGLEMVDTIALMFYLQIDFSLVLFELVAALRPKLSLELLDYAAKKLPGLLKLSLNRPVPEIVNRRDYTIPWDGLKWSADGKKVAINFTKPDRKSYTQVYLAEPDGYRAIGPEISGTSDEWSPNSQMLVVRLASSGQIYRVVGSELVLLNIPNFSNGRSYQFCGWSPDSRYVVQCILNNLYAGRNRILRIQDDNQVLALDNLFLGYDVQFSPEGTRFLVKHQTVDWRAGDQDRNLIMMYEINEQAVVQVLGALVGELSGWGSDGTKFWTASRTRHDLSVLDLYARQFASGSWHLVDQQFGKNIYSEKIGGGILAVRDTERGYGLSLLRIGDRGWKSLSGTIPTGQIASLGKNRFVNCALDTDIRKQACQLYQIEGSEIVRVGAPIFNPANNFFKMDQDEWLFFSGHNQKNTRFPVSIYQATGSGLSIIDQIVLQAAWEWIPNRGEIYGPVTFANYHYQLEFIKPNPLGLMVREMFKKLDQISFYEILSEMPLIQQLFLSYLADQYDQGRFNLGEALTFDSLNLLFQNLPVVIQDCLFSAVNLPGQAGSQAIPVGLVEQKGQHLSAAETEVNLDVVPEIPTTQTCTSWLCNLLRRWRR